MPAQALWLDREDCEAVTSHPIGPGVKALAVLWHPDGDRILVGTSDDDPRHPPFQRLLGGRIQFGERAGAALERELMEELGLRVHVGRFVTMLEVLFSYRGAPGHDIAIVYEATFDDRTVYDRAEILGLEDPPHHAVWRSLSSPPVGVLLAPEGIAAFL